MEGLLLLQAERAILLIFFLSFPLATVVSAQGPINYGCSNANYSQESNYKSSLSNLLLNLSSQASVKWFSQGTMGQSPYEVHARYLCRGDATHEICRNCVGNATGTLVKYCPHSSGAMIWYDECFLRYGHTPFFGKVDSSWNWAKCNTQNITNTDVNSFVRAVNNTLTNVAIETAKGDHSGNKYAHQEVKLSQFATLYSLGQCTPDLSVADCNSCLTESIFKLFESCYGTKGGTWFHGASCYIGYDIFDFYNIPVAAQAPAAAPAHATSPAGGIKNSTLMSPEKKSSHKVIMAVVIPVALAMLLVGIGIYLLSQKIQKKKGDVSRRDADNLVAAESLQYDLVTVQTATNYFCSENKIGEGGFGSVYKGTLADGQEIAVKRLNKKSSQGAVQFKNEINLLAKLQHKNLVRLLGFCLDRNEKLLVYEFVPNKSLDYFLFGTDHERKGQLDWPSRYNIISGIARGMLYLHEDSRLRIIHRDLKVSNILLEMDLNPKISDFGLARIFGMDQTHNETERLAGTFGYMAPEYIARGLYSMKSDVYSFGVLVLEIISGRKNNSFHRASGDLLGHAWKCWIDCSALEFTDPASKDSCNSSDELKFCLQLGLLCVQKDPDQRPTMARIVQMLDDNSLSTLPVPQHPPFYIEGNITDSSSTEKGLILALNSSMIEVTITDIEAR